MLNSSNFKIFSIGRSSSNNIYNIFNKDTNVSNKHCEIFIDDHLNKFLTDLNSTNGTFVNGVKIIQPIKLEKNDVLKLGNTVFNWEAYFDKYYKKSDDYFEQPKFIKASENIKKNTPKSKKNNKVDFNNKKLIAIFFFIILLSFLIFNKNNKVHNLVPDEVSDYEDITIDEKVLVNNSEISDLPLLSSIRPINGFSPYNDYYGKGIYDNSCDNTIKITAPISKDIVIMFKNIYSNRMIRNEYVRAGSVFSLTGVPFGTYKFFYIYGDDWSNDADFKGGLAKGNFLNDKGKLDKLL